MGELIDLGAARRRKGGASRIGEDTIRAAQQRRHETFIRHVAALDPTIAENMRQFLANANATELELLHARGIQ